MDKLSNMEAFAAVGETGSFAEAARRLNIANSVVSKRVKDLEDYLGSQLFIRTTRKVTLTETGYSYLEYVRRILGDIDEVEGRIRYHVDTPSGTLRLAAPLSFGVRYLGDAVSSYLAKYPHVQVKTYLSDRRVNLVDEGYDLSIRSGPLEDASLIAKKIQTSRRVVCGSPGYFKQHGKPRTPEELKSHNCLSYLNLADGKSWPFRINGKRAWQPVNGSFQSDNGDLLHQAALNGAGLTLLPTFIVGESIAAKKLQIVLPEYEEEDFHMYAVYQHTKHLSIKVRTMIDHLTAYLASHEIILPK